MEGSFAMPTSIGRRPGMKNKEDTKSAEKKENSEEKAEEKNETQKMETSEITPAMKPPAPKEAAPKPKEAAPKPKDSADKPKEDGAGEVTAVLNYKPPKWSGAPAFPYTLEVLKNGKILEEVYYKTGTDRVRKYCIPDWLITSHMT